MEKINKWKRIGAMYFDQMIMSTIAIVPVGIIFIFTFKYEISHKEIHFIYLKNIMLLIAIAFNVYLLKDSFNGRSIGKRIFGFQLINRHGNVATPLQCYIRNLFFIIYPIEVIFVFFNPSRRLGDFVAGTTVVEYANKRSYSKIAIFHTILIFIVFTTLFWFILKPFDTFLKNEDTKRIQYIETSYNKQKSEEANELLKNSLGENFTPDVVFYDSMKIGNDNYIDVLIRFKNYGDLDAIRFDSINSKTKNVLKSKFSKNIKGRIQYYYKSNKMKNDFDVTTERL